MIFIAHQQGHTVTSMADAGGGRLRLTQLDPRWIRRWRGLGGVDFFRRLAGAW